MLKNFLYDLIVCVSEVFIQHPWIPFPLVEASW